MVAKTQISTSFSPSFDQVAHHCIGNYNSSLKNEDFVSQAVDLNSELVCIHDSARPLVLTSDITKVWLHHIIHQYMFEIGVCCHEQNYYLPM